MEAAGRDARSVVECATAVVVGDADDAAAMEALEACESVRAALEGIDERLAAANADYRLGRVVDTLDRTARHGGDIAELGLQTTMRREERSEAVTEGE